MNLEIVESEKVTGAIVDEMEGLRRRIYKDDPHYCPPFDGSLERELRRAEFVDRQRIFLVRRAEEVVGCAVVRRSQSLELAAKSVATVGNFESLDDEEAVSRLLTRATGWAIDEGSQVVVGPMNGDTWHRYRWNVGPFDERPYLKEPYNPPYYPDLWKKAGFEVIQGYYSQRVEDLEGARRHHQPRWARSRALGYRLDPMTPKSLERDLDRVYEMVRVIFSKGFLYTSISRRDFGELYEGSEVLLDGDTCFFVVGPNGEDAAFSFCFPDYFEAVQAMEGKKNLWAKLKFLANRKKHRANIKTVGVMPEHRRKGLMSAMSYQYFDAMIEKGFKEATICLIMDGNPSTAIDAGLGRELRRYELYQWAGPKDER